MVDDAAADPLNIGLMLFIPYRAMENQVFVRLAEAGYDDFTIAQARVLQRIGPNGTRLTELAEQAQVTKQTAGFLVDAMERTGYVERVPDPTDGRARLVRIAERGMRAVAIAAEAVREVETEWSAHLGQRCMDELRQTLTKLRALTDPYA